MALYIHTVRKSGSSPWPPNSRNASRKSSISSARPWRAPAFRPPGPKSPQALGFRSPNAAEDHLKALARKGAIELTAGASRGIRLKVPDSATPSAQLTHPLLAQLVLPLVGRVAAGSPILASEHVEREVGVDPGLFAQTPDYLLRCAA